MDEDKPKTPVEKPSEQPVESKTDSQKLKEENDALQVELERAQKIRNEALMSGTSGAATPPEPVKEESPKEYNDRIDKELSDGKHDE